MKVLVLVKATVDSEAGVMSSEEMLRAMGQFNEDLVKAGVLLAAEGLRPSAHGKRVRYSGPKRTVIDGPFAETKELIAGFWIWQVKTIDEAVEWLKRCPIQMEDFGAGLTPELRAQMEHRRSRIADPDKH